MAIELDFFEYANDAAAQAAYPTSKEKGTEALLTSYDGSEDALIYISGETGSAEKQGQEFQIQQKAFITKAIVKLQKINSPTDNIVVRIESNSNGLPSGNLVNDNATKARVASGISASLAWETFTFDAGFWLEPDTIYHLVIQRSGARDTTNRIAVSLDNTSPTYGYGNREEKANCTWDDTGMTGQDINFQVYGQPLTLQCYSESSIKEQGSYSMKVFALQSDALNAYLERTIESPIDLSNRTTIKFDIRASRTGSNIKIGIRDSGGVYTEVTPNITNADTFQNVQWDISGVDNANKDAIDRIKITIVNADATNAFYIDNLYAESDYTFSVSPGSYSITGQAIGLLADRIISIEGGSYTLSGQAVSPFYNRVISIGTGNYTLSGQTINLLADRFISIDAGNYTLSGQNVTTLWNKVLSIGAGSYTLTGLSIELYTLIIMYLSSKIQDSISARSEITDSLSRESTITDSLTLKSSLED